MAKTTAEAAAELGVTPGRVRQMVLNRELVAEKFGRDLMISDKSIRAAKKRKTKPGPKPITPTRKPLPSRKKTK